jgi:hypothetical protein
MDNLGVVYTIIQLVPKTLWGSTQTYPSGKETVISKISLPFPLNIHYLLCYVDY